MTGQTVFYDFDEKLGDWSSSGGVCDLRGEEWDGIVVRAGGEESPEIIRHLNRVLYCNFSGQDHYVSLEKRDEGYAYVHRWRNGLKNSEGRKDIAEFNPENLPMIAGGMLMFRAPHSAGAGKQSAIVVPFDSRRERRPEELFDVNALLGGPTPYQRGYISPSSVAGLLSAGMLVTSAELKPLDVHGGYYGVEFDTVESGAATKADETPVIAQTLAPTIDQRPAPVAKAGDVPAADRPPVVNGPPQKIPRPDVTPEDFTKTIVERAKEQGGEGGVRGKDVDIVFAIDNSGSMTAAVVLAIRSVGEIIRGLKDEGTKGVRIGLVTFNDWGSIHTRMPLIAMNKSNALNLFELLGTMEFSGGFEPVGKAVFASFGLFDKEEAIRQVVVLTDNDGLIDDRMASPTFDDARAAAGKISVNLHVIEEETAVPIGIAAKIQKLVYLDDKAELLTLARDSGDDRVRFEAARALAGLGERARKELLFLSFLDADDYNYASVPAIEKAGLSAIAKAGLSAIGLISDRESLVGILDDLQDEAPVSAEDILWTAIVLSEKVDASPEDIADELVDIYESIPERRRRITMKGLSLLSDHTAGMEFLKATVLPAVKEITEDVSDENIAVRIFNLMNDYLAMGHSFSEAREYGLMLAEKPEDILVKLGGSDYRVLTGLIVNTDDIHYYVNASREEGREQMRRLTYTAEKEDAWIYVRYKKNGVEYSRFIEAGVMEDAGNVTANMAVIVNLINDPDVEVSEITNYHTHPYGESEVMEQLLLSPEDIVSAVQIARKLRELGYRGLFDSRAVTPFGEYILTANDDAEGDVNAAGAAYKGWVEARSGTHLTEAGAIEGINASGLVEAKYAYHSAAIEPLFRAHIYYSDFVKRYNEVVGGKNGTYPTTSGLTQLSSELARVLEYYDLAIHTCRGSGLPAKILAPYEREHESGSRLSHHLAPLVAAI